MCGRFVSASPPDQVAAYFDAMLSETALEPSYNVAPTNDIYAVVQRPQGRQLEVVRWGLVPAWADDPKVGQRMINARAEGIETKGAYRSALRSKRCLIPADGFFEWQAVAGSRTKQPLYLHRADGEPLAFAGLWSAWRPKGSAPGEPWLFTATIITVAANRTLAPVHDRMPAILPPSAWEAWLGTEAHDAAEASRLLVPAPDHLLTMHPVSTAVNKVTNQGPELIVPEPPPDSLTEGTLFPNPA